VIGNWYDWMITVLKRHDLSQLLRNKTMYSAIWLYIRAHLLHIDVYSSKFFILPIVKFQY
jgi:hypothetical protein